MLPETRPPTTRPSPDDPKGGRPLKVRTQLRAGLGGLPAALGPRRWGGDIEIGQGI